MRSSLLNDTSQSPGIACHVSLSSLRYSHPTREGFSLAVVVALKNACADSKVSSSLTGSTVKLPRYSGIVMSLFQKFRSTFTRITPYSVTSRPSGVYTRAFSTPLRVCVSKMQGRFEITYLESLLTVQSYTSLALIYDGLSLPRIFTVYPA